LIGASVCTKNLRRIGIHLARHRRHQAVAQAVAHPDRAAEGEHRFTLAHVGVRRQRQRRQLQAIDLQHREIELGRDADDARGNMRILLESAVASVPSALSAGKTICTSRAVDRARW
jgi:hypothetical protein